MSLRPDSVIRLFRKSSVLRNRSTKCWTRMTLVMNRKLHCGPVLYDKSIDDKMSQTPYPFMSSLKGNTQVRQEAIDYEDEWRYQGFVIFGSMTAFFIYFLMMRKEREVDRAIEQTLYKGMPALEVYDLRKAIKKNKAEGKDTKELEDRLKVVLTPPQNRNL